MNHIPMPFTKTVPGSVFILYVCISQQSRKTEISNCKHTQDNILKCCIRTSLLTIAYLRVEKLRGFEILASWLLLVGVQILWSLSFLDWVQQMFPWAFPGQLKQSNVKSVTSYKSFAFFCSEASHIFSDKQL